MRLASIKSHRAWSFCQELAASVKHSRNIIRTSEQTQMQTVYGSLCSSAW